VVKGNDSLYAKFPSKTLWLNPAHPNVFETYYVIDDKVETEDQDNSIKFITDFEGEITGLEVALERRLDPIIFN